MQIDSTFIDPELEASSLCCCEYYNRENERFHILGCCCNCKHFDIFFDRLISCKGIEKVSGSEMLLTFQDRLRIPWFGGKGAKRVSFSVIAPGIFLPIVIGLAAINFTMASIISVGFVSFITGSIIYLWKKTPRTNFFFALSVWLIIYIVVLFEFTVPMMEILPEENIILGLFVLCSSLSFRTCKKKSHLNKMVQSSTPGTECAETEEQTTLLLDINESEKSAQERNFYCISCQACILRRDHHNYFMDCCIGESNHRYYFAGLVFGVLGLIVLSNLAMTAVCHPVLLFRFMDVGVMLPDDCSDVFDQFDVGLAFITSVLSLIIAVFLLGDLIFQIYLISRGITCTEFRQGKSSNRRSIVKNWKSFFSCFY